MHCTVPAGWMDGCFDSRWWAGLLGGPDCSLRPGAWVWLRAARTLQLLRGDLSVAATRKGRPLVAGCCPVAVWVSGAGAAPASWADRGPAVECRWTVTGKVFQTNLRTRLYAFKVALCVEWAKSKRGLGKILYH